MPSHQQLISVAMCTYNGARFVTEQLESIQNQTLLPNELVVCDDGSTDNTLALVEQFAKKAPFPVRIFQNEHQLGVTKNFEKALTHCRGDLLFLADQDDCWVPEKIAHLSKVFSENPPINVIFSDALLVDEHTHSLQKHFWEVVRFGTPQQEQWKQGRSIEILLVGNRVAGCTMAVRKSFVDKVLPFPTDISTFLHDTWMAYVAAILNQIQFIPEVLIHYRQHSSQQIGTQQKNGQSVTLTNRFSRPHSNKLAPLQKQAEDLQKVYAHLARIIPSTHPNLQVVAEKVHFLNVRAHLPDNRLRRIWPTLAQWRKGNYRRFADQDATSAGILLTALGDILE